MIRKLLLSLLGMVMSLYGLAEIVKITVDDINYSVNTETGKASVVRQSSDLTKNNLVIPEYVTYESQPFPVDSIGFAAFYKCTGLTGSVTIPNSVTIIGEAAFQYCTGLTGSLTIPNSVTIIEEYAFYGCSGFTGSLTIPDSVTEIGAYAFEDCSGFTGSLTISNSVTKIGNFAFSFCSGFTGSLTIPNSVTEIGKDAFFRCSGFTGSLTLSDSLTEIGEWTFRECSGFTEPLIIPNSVTKIGEGAFYGCSGFTGSPTISNSVTEIGEYAFAKCTGFSGSLKIPDSVTDIGNEAFAGCRGITDPIVIGKSVTSVGYYSFANINTSAFVFLSDVPLSYSDLFYCYKIPVYVHQNSLYDYQKAWPSKDIRPLKFDFDYNWLNLWIDQKWTINSFIEAPEPFNNPEIEFSSSDPTVASVDEDGEMTGLSVGKCIISASIKDNILEFPDATVNITVSGMEFAYGADQIVSIGGQTQLFLKFIPNGLTESMMQWKSSDPNIATVDDSGVVTGVAAGKAVISVTAGRQTLECNIYVYSRIDEAGDNALVMKTKDARQLPGVQLPEGCPLSTTWYSYDPNIVAVDENGLVTAVSPGHTDVSLRTKYEGITHYLAFYDIWVCDNFVLNKSESVLSKGSNEILLASLQPEGLAGPPVKWKSSDPEVATVDQSGQVTAEGEGKAIISATVGDLTADCSVYVFTYINETEDNAPFMKTKETLQLSGAQLPEGFSSSVSWVSSDTQVVTVDENGLVTAVSAGRASVAEIALGSLLAEYEIWVYDDFVLSKSEMVLAKGASETLTATFVPEDLPSRSVEWTSSNPNVVRVDESGCVTAMRRGQAIITATSGPLTAECTVYVVNPINETGEAARVMKTEETAQLAGARLPEGFPSSVTWTSSDARVVTVDENGLVTAVGTGHATVTENALGSVLAEYEIWVYDSMVLNKSEMVLSTGASETLVAAFEPEGLGSQVIKWKTSFIDVARVDESGLVTARAAGKAIITATSGTLTAECIVYVVSPVSETGDGARVMSAEETAQLEGAQLPEGLASFVSWVSSDTEIVTVDENGLVTAVGAGHAIVTQTALGSVLAEYEISVYDFVLNKSELVLAKGASEALRATFVPEDLPSMSVEWKSSDPEVVSVDNTGRVTAMAGGKATITAKAGAQFEASCTVYVPSLSFLEKEKSLIPGETAKLNPIIEPSELEWDLEWSSSDPSVVTVDEAGVITGVKQGSAIITVRSEKYEVSANETIYVSGMSISIEETILKPGAATRVEVNLTDDVANEKVSWASSNPYVATVDNNGNVTAKAVGNATISATLSSGLSVSADLFVAKIEIPASQTLSVGETANIPATVQPDELSEMALAWTSSDENCVSVEADGTLHVVGMGTATLTVALADAEQIAAECQITTTLTDEGATYTYDAIKDGLVLTEISDIECYIVRPALSVPYGNSSKEMEVKGVKLARQPEALKKVAYPEFIPNNFAEDVISIPYPRDSRIENGLITHYEELLFVDMSVNGEFEISTAINSIGKDAFALCSQITSLKIADGAETLSFEAGTSDGRPVFADIPLTSVYVGRDVSYMQSPFKSHSTLSEVSFGGNVTGIPDYMFYNCRQIREISIPANVAFIGEQAFGACHGLSQVIIEDSRNSLTCDESFKSSPVDYLYYGREVYYGHEVTTEITWPTSLKSIETGRYVDNLKDKTFANLPNLYSLTIGVGMRTLAAGAFANSSVTKVIWMPNTPPDNYKSISASVNYVSTNNYDFDNKIVSPNLSSKFVVDGLVYVFNKEASDRTCALIDSRYNRYITDLDVPHHLTYLGIEFTVEEINDYALYKNEYYQTASVGDGIMSIGNYALYGCNEISREPYIGKSVKTIGDYAFYDCSGIPSIVIPDATEYLGRRALSVCNVLKNVTLGMGLKVIEEGCFAYDGKLSQLIVPANVERIANQVFTYCESLSYFEISDRTSTLSLGNNGGKPLFSDCPLKEVYIGGDITYSTAPADGYSPFYRNDNLEKVTIHNNETEISDNEFYGCRNLKDVIVGNDVINVGDYAFSGCLSLENFTLGRSVESIGVDAFSDCDKMVELRSYSLIPPICGDQALDDINKFTCTLYVPHQAVESYMEANQWKNFYHIEGIDTDEILVEEIVLDPSSWAGEAGTAIRIHATVYPMNAENKSLSWSSSNVAVAEVDDEGYVTLQGEGTCVITVRANDGSNVSATCEISVTFNSGIDTVTAEEETLIVYTLQGVRLDITTAEELNRLSSGIYIVNGHKVFIR